MHDEAVDLQHGTRADRDLHTCIKAKTPSKDVAFKDPFIDIMHCTLSY